jgi:hypothetical protein
LTYRRLPVDPTHTIILISLMTRVETFVDAPVDFNQEQVPINLLLEIDVLVDSRRLLIGQLIEQPERSICPAKTCTVSNA